MHNYQLTDIIPVCELVLSLIVVQAMAPKFLQHYICHLLFLCFVVDIIKILGGHSEAGGESLHEWI